MKRLITIILALIMVLFTAPNQGADRADVSHVNAPVTAITASVEQETRTSIRQNRLFLSSLAEK